MPAVFYAPRLFDVFHMTWPLEKIREQFPALTRTVNNQTAVYFDGPAGSQVPQSVADAVSKYLLTTNANRGAAHATAVESDELLEHAHDVFADFLGTEDSASICFGANMTTITLAVSRALAKSWQPGDEIILSRLDHDANVTPWVLAARDAGVTVHYIDLNPSDWTLNQEDYRSKLSEKTKLVAFGYASNATGTINPVNQMVADARNAGAMTYIDAVHYAPHGRINVSDIGCDFSGLFRVQILRTSRWRVVRSESSAGRHPTIQATSFARNVAR